MKLDIREESIFSLDEYAQIPIALLVETRFEVDIVADGPHEIVLRELPVNPPYVKDYDAIRGEGPGSWRHRWDIRNWGILSAFDHEERIGGAAIAFDTEGFDMLEGRRDIAVLWDLRVRPDYRRHGVAGALFRAAIAWARARDCRSLVIETQNINVPACRFYARQGCVLVSADRLAYPDLPAETQLIWHKHLDEPRATL